VSQVTKFAAVKPALFALLVFGAVLAACGGDSAPTSTAAAGGPTGRFPADAFAVRANADISVGKERLLVAIAQPDGTRLGSPNQPVMLEVTTFDEPGAVQTVAGIFTWVVPGGSGVYRGAVEFDQPGNWQVTVIPAEGDPLEAVPFSVLDPACRDEDAAAQGIPQCAVRVGEVAPQLATPTLDDLPLVELTSDNDPNEDLYRLSLDGALTNGRKTVVVFSTPAYCQTAACGPLLEGVKSILPEYPGVDFVHIEVYTGLTEAGFQPDADHIAPAVLAYDLVSEPWVYVMDEAGVVVARFEGVMNADELRPYL
jgi:hypothetical protein